LSSLRLGGLGIVAGGEPVAAWLGELREPLQVVRSYFLSIERGAVGEVRFRAVISGSVEPGAEHPLQSLSASNQAM
jgi:hypothetical protein